MSSFFNTSSRGSWVVALILCLGLGFAPVALAANSVKGTETVDEVNAMRRTLSLAGQDYWVSPTTLVQGMSGERIRITDLKATNGRRDANAHVVEFVATQKGTKARWVLLSVKVVGFEAE